MVCLDRLLSLVCCGIVVAPQGCLDSNGIRTCV